MYITINRVFFIGLLGLLPASAQADDGTLTMSSDEATFTTCVETCSTDLVIPATINAYSVTSIGSYPFPQMHRVRILVTQPTRKRI